MIRTVITDDDKRSRMALSNLIRDSFPHIEIIAEAESAEQGKDAILKLAPDLIFLDVEMPGKTGFELLHDLSRTASASLNLNVIFTTAHEHYALQAIKASALDFLLKPIGEDDLRESLERLDRKRTKEQIVQQMEVLFQHYSKDSNPNKKIALPTITGYVFVQISNIVRCEADRNYSVFYFADKTKLMVSKTLKDCEEILTDYGFFRVHNSHLINMNFVKEYIKGEGGIVKMNDGTEIEVARRKKDEFLLKLSKV